MKSFLLAVLIWAMPIQPNLTVDEVLDWEPQPNGMILVEHPEVAAYYNYNHDISGLCPQPAVSGYVLLKPEGEGLQFCYQVYPNPVGYRTETMTEDGIVYGFKSFTQKTYPFGR